MTPKHALLLCALGGCTDSAASTNKGLYLNAALGFTLIESPLASEGSVDALILVTRDTAQGETVKATLTINGVEVPAGFLGYDLRSVTIPDATPGGQIDVHASFGSDTADLTLRCPSEVSLTGPATAAAGDQITMSWSGEIDHATSIKPDIMVRGLDPGSGTKRDLGFADRPESGHASDTFALPALGTASQWLVDLYVPGDLENTAQGVGFCELDRRVRISQR